MDNDQKQRITSPGVLPSIAKIVFGAGVLISWLMLAYGIRYFTMVRNVEPVLVWLYGIACLFAAGLSAWAFRFKFEVQRKLLVSLVLAIACLYIVEFAVRLFETIHGFPNRGVNDVTAASVFIVNANIKANVINQLRVNGNEVYSSTLPRLFESVMMGGAPIMSLGGISRATIVYCDEDGYWSIYESDEYGFNNPRELHQITEVDLALIGDSFIEGACVKPDSTVSAVMRKLGYSAISFGRGGSGPLIELAILREYVQALKPKVVLWFYSEVADLTDLSLEETVPLLMRYYYDAEFSQHLSSRQYEVDRNLKAYLAAQPAATVKAEVQQTRPIDVYGIWKLDRVRELLHLKLPNPIVPPPELFGRIMEKVKSSVDRWNGRLYFVYLPGRSRYVVHRDRLLRDPKARELVLDVVSKLKIPIIDIHQELFALNADPLLYFDLSGTDHYNAFGYRAVGELVANRLAQDGFGVNLEK